MSPSPPAQRIELSPPVRAILEADHLHAQFLQDYLRYLEALLASDLAEVDSVVTSDVRCHELEAMGLPPGREGLKIFRGMINGAAPDEHILIAAVRFEGDDVIETDLIMNATQTGDLMGIPATGRKIRFDVHERCRFVAGKLVERWAQIDFEDIKRKLTGPLE